MSFRDIELLGSYDSGFGDFDVVKQFYTPVLEQSLSWTVLTTLAQSVDVVVQPADPLFELTLNVQYRVQIPS